MSTVKIAPGHLGAFLKRSVRGNAAAIHRGLVAGARRGAQYLASRNGPTPIFNGVLRNAWEVQVLGPGQAKIVNSAPYAGVMERGARPYKIGREGIEAIREWVRLKIALMDAGGGKVRPLSPQEATHEGGFGYFIDDITWAIVKKIERDGIQGRFFVRGSLDKLRSFLDEEVGISLHNELDKGGAS